MAGVSWFKMQVGFYRDEKLKQIETLPSGHEIAYLWSKILSLTAEKNLGGELIFHDEQAYTPEMLATEFNVKPAVMRLALKTFREFRMINVESDGTIVILNWHKHQNLEGLEKIRAQNAERQKRHREKRIRERAERLLSRCNVDDRPSSLRRGLADCNATHNVAERDRQTLTGVTVTPSEREEDKRVPLLPSSPKERTDGNVVDDLNFSEAKQWLGELFGRKRPWSEDEDQLLEKLVPISWIDRKLIDWGYSLERDEQGWACYCDTRLSKPKQNLIGLLREFASEVDKWRGAREQCGLSVTFEEPRKKEEPPRWREFFISKYGQEQVSAKTPASFSFWDLPRCHREEYEREFSAFEKATPERPPA